MLSILYPLKNHCLSFKTYDIKVGRTKDIKKKRDHAVKNIDMNMIEIQASP